MNKLAKRALKSSSVMKIRSVSFDFFNYWKFIFQCRCRFVCNL